MTKCPSCGAPVEAGKCTYCGAQVAEVAPAQPAQPVVQQAAPPVTYVVNGGQVINSPQKSKTTALLLCIFLGFLGVHCFYTNKAGAGILYLLTAGLFGIGWIVDIIRIATNSYTDKFGRALV